MLTVAHALLQNLRRLSTAVTREPTLLVMLTQLDFLRARQENKLAKNVKHERWCDFLLVRTHSHTVPVLDPDISLPTAAARQTVPLFRRWNKMSIMRLVFFIDEQRFRRGQVVMTQGEAAANVLIVVRACAAA
jgi:hypothetical protein